MNSSHISGSFAVVGLEQDAGHPHLGEFGDYEILEEIARGGMGVVYRARQVSLNREVAVKMILSSTLASDEDLARFRTEAEAAAAINHPNIVPIYEVGEIDGQHFFSMKRVEGGTLQSRQAEFAEDPRASAELTVKLARAVHTAHQAGVLHRDLKPGNILLDASGEPMISDFGLAKRIGAEQQLTLTGQVVGTPAYMSPEQAAGGKLTTASDVYSLGALFYQLITGEPPFKGDTLGGTLQMVAKEAPRRPRAIKPGLDRDLETIALKCLRKDPDRRYGSARELAEDLERWIRGEPITARHATRTERLGKWAKRNPALAAAWMAGTLFLLTLSIGGPITAYHQANLRDEAEQARVEAERTLYVTQMNLAAREWGEPGSYTAVERIVEAWAPRHQRSQTPGWEWYFHRARLYQDEFTLKTGNGDPLCDVAWSPDGSRLASAGSGVVYIWEAKPGDAATVLKGGPKQPQELEWSPDGELLACGGVGDVGLAIWNSKTGERIAARRPAELPVLSVGWSPDGERLATAGADKLVRVWDRSGRPLREMPGHTTEIREVDWLPDGKRVLSGARDYTARIWDVESGKELSQFRVGYIRQLAVDPGGNRFAAGIMPDALEVRRIDTGEVIFQVDEPGDHQMTDIIWSPDGTLIATGSEDRGVKLWDAETGAKVRQFQGHSTGVEGVAFAPDGRRIASAGGDGVVKVWGLDSAIPARTRVPEELVELRFSPGGERLAGAGLKKVFVLDPETAQVTATIDGVMRTGRFDWSPDGRRLAAFLPQDGEIAIYSADGVLEKTFAGILRGPVESFGQLAWAGGGETIAVAVENGEIALVDADKGKTLRAMRARKGLRYLRASPDGRQLLSVGPGHLQLWDAATGEEIEHRDTAHRTFRAFDVRWTADAGPRIAISGYRQPKVSILGFGNDPGEVELAGHPVECIVAAWSPDGSRLATGGNDRTIRLWDLADGQHLLTLRGPSSRFKALAWSPDGRCLLSTGEDGEILRWDATVGYEMASHPKD